MKLCFTADVKQYGTTVHQSRTDNNYNPVKMHIYSYWYCLTYIDTVLILYHKLGLNSMSRSAQCLYYRHVGSDQRQVASFMHDMMD